MPDDSSAFVFEDDPVDAGWKRWRMADDTRFNAVLGPLAVRVEDGIARVRMTPARTHSNIRGQVHGGALLAFVDVAMFAGCRGLGVLASGAAVTLDLSTQFIGGGAIDRAIEARVELLRETTRLLFVRGLVVQDGATLASFAGTLRKSTPPGPAA